MNNIDTFKFSDGQFLATNSGGDAALRLNTPIPVDTRKYKYLSFRMLLEGEFDLFGGWVSRLFWYDSPRQPSISDDIVIRPGWNTYTLDLTKAVTEPGSSPWSSDSWEWIRFDPNENIRGVPWTFHIDYLVLTGDPTGKTNSNVSIWYELSEQAGVTVKLYYDKDTKPGGEVPIVEHFATSPQLAGPYFVYAPGVSGNYTPSELPEPTGIRVQWDTTGVPAGSYYILAEASDGFNVTRWYSEVPLVLSSN
jgi:hypothetical protein